MLPQARGACLLDADASGARIIPADLSSQTGLAMLFVSHPPARHKEPMPNNPRRAAPQQPALGAKITRALYFGVPTLLVVVGVATALMYWQQQRAIPGKVQAYLAAGDAYVAQAWYDRAAKEYEAALALDPGHVDARRRLIGAWREELLLAGFGPGSEIDPALRVNYARHELVPAVRVERVLAMVREVNALDSASNRDPRFLLDHALVLKVAGQVPAAITVLDLAYRIAPNDADIAAELGLLRALEGLRTGRGAEGLGLVRYAVASRPDEARFRLYLARILHEASGCGRASAQTVRFVPRAGGNPCDEVRREYLRAEELARGEDIWSRRIKLLAGKAARQPSLH